LGLAAGGAAGGAGGGVLRGLGHRTTGNNGI
jgi:hypothetical protein